jgi:hypothetical protein
MLKCNLRLTLALGEKTRNFILANSACRDNIRKTVKGVACKGSNVELVSVGSERNTSGRINEIRLLTVNAYG